MARTCRTSRRPPRDLDALARQLDAIAEEAGWGAPPLLIGLTDEGVDDLNPPAPVPGSSGTDPADLVASLVGFDAPAEWQAVAIVVQGRSWALGAIVVGGARSRRGKLGRPNLPETAPAVLGASLEYVTRRPLPRAVEMRTSSKPRVSARGGCLPKSSRQLCVRAS